MVVDTVGRPRSVALLSGSFDPPTVGHVGLAEAAAEGSELVVLVYSVRTLPKEGATSPPLLSEQERVQALEVLCGGGSRRLAAAVCSHGLLLDQAAAAALRFPGAVLHVVVGSDKALQMLDPRWYDDRDGALERLFALADVRYAVRGGDEGAVEAALELPENTRWRGRFRRLEIAPEISAVSSRYVRDRVRAGGDVTDLVPPEVLSYLSRV